MFLHIALWLLTHGHPHTDTVLLHFMSISPSEWLQQYFNSNITSNQNFIMGSLKQAVIFVITAPEVINSEKYKAI